MNAITKAQNAYRNDAQLIRTDRDTEYNAFAEITHRLKTASSRGADGFRDLAGALHDNRRLWTILAMDVADKSNTLPEMLRARILYLSEFTQQHSSKVLTKQATVDALVEINTAIMRGLRNKRVK
ncbi:flagellar biosynthesis regulator FlaF [Roseovarius aestuarii]|uniref:Flagellar biosynthesis regulatory protein FlaF n=1 Tax=Roseovarius aestuarii TaxID=475083 RepID=A0A1X7BQB9_9RHOB|nr:flagellar biosynthesis regulator FlaF [Roseovarius aestuarii]SMC11876.1 flagellar biosynthesis regulatory protein FlaF [Roseovarius aestuarii]